MATFARTAAKRLLFGVALLCAAGVAAAGGIAGTVRRAGDSTPIAGATVSALRASNFTLGGQATTLADGSYSITLTNDTYLVATFPDGYVGEFYDDMPCGSGCEFQNANPVVVSGGATVGGVDFDLAQLGAISGTIRRSGTLAPLEGVTLTASTLTGEFASSTSSDAAGQYTLLVESGTFRITTDSGAVSLGEVYDDVPCTFAGCDLDAATNVTVGGGSTVANIDFTLVAGGSIAGTVRRQSDGLPFVGVVEIDVTTQGGQLLSQFLSPDAAYQIPTGLPTGNYRVVARPFGNFLPEVWNNHACTGPESNECDGVAGDAVAVVQGSTTPAIDFSVSRSTAIVRGRVTAFAGGAPLDGVDVKLRREGSGEEFNALTNAAGDWEIEVGPGSYTAHAVAPPPMADEAFPNVQCPAPFFCDGTPTVLVLAAEDERTGIDFALAPIGSITIGVRDGAGGALIGAELRVLRSQVPDASTLNTNDGSRVTIPMPSGGTIRFAARSLDASCGPAPLRVCLAERWPGDECAGLQCDLAAGTPIPVSKGENVTGIDLSLGPGAAVTGRVRAADDLSPVSALVQVVDGNNVAIGGGFTDDQGNYRVDGLGVGPYFARTNVGSGFIDELYDNVPCPSGACSPGSGLALSPPVAQDIANIDFLLDRGSSIRGVVRSALGADISGATINVFDSAGLQVALTTSAANGSYVTPALAGGTFRVRFDADGFASQLYDGIACAAQSCDPLNGTPVVVTTSADTTGINGSLAGGIAPPTRLIYLNNCKPSGCVVRSGFDSSINNTSSIVSGTRNLPPFPFSDAVWSQVVQCVRKSFAPFGVNITTTDPGNQPHREQMVTTTPATIGQPNYVGGVSPWACGTPLENSIAYTFATGYGADAGAICNVAAHEIGHQFGLDHAFYCPDHLTYMENCGAKSYTDVDTQCGTFSAKPCYCDANVTPIQNSFRKLLSQTGHTTRVFASGFEPPPPDPLGQHSISGAGSSILCGTITERASSPSLSQPPR